MSQTPEKKASTEPTQTQDPPKPERKAWNDSATKLQEMKKALDYLALLSLQLRDSDVNVLDKCINDTFQTYSELNKKYWVLIGKIIDLRDNYGQNSKSQAKHFVKSLGDLLDEQDIIPIDLARGSPYPDDKCIVKLRVTKKGLLPDMVEQVLTPPYVTKSGLLVRPGTIVATQRQSTP